MTQKNNSDDRQASERSRDSAVTQQRQTRGYGRWLILLLVLAAVALLVWRIRGHAPASAMNGRFSGAGAMPVVAATAHKGDVKVELDALGTVTPLANVTVRTQIAGQLMQVGFREGQVVRKGDFLAQIDARPYEAALEQAQGELARDQALLSEARLNLQRYETLYAQDSIAKQQVDTQQSLVQQYEGTVKIDQAQIGVATLNIGYCHVTAPVAGRVGLRQVDAGNYVQTGDSNGLVVLTQLQPISVIFTVPEDNVPQILDRMHSGATLDVTAYDRSSTNELADGKLLAIDNQVDPTTGTVKLRAEFGNKDLALFPNQFVNARLLIDTLHDVIVIPNAAVQRGTPGTYVYLIKPDNTVTARPVTLGPVDGEQVAITAGLKAGDVVVVDGADKLKDGAKIALPAAATDDSGKAGQGAPSHQHTRKGT
ncbi:MAG: MdtA/MuxA family multidrug efflux RND transporter periplasmic adaptor subunit [Stenotrophobium sp.]